MVTVHLKLNHNSTAALAEVTARLQQVRSELPPDAEPPATEIQRAGGYAELPKSFGETIQFWRRAGEFPPRRTYAHLRGPAFSNQ